MSDDDEDYERGLTAWIAPWLKYSKDPAAMETHLRAAMAGIRKLNDEDITDEAVEAELMREITDHLDAAMKLRASH